MCKQRQERHARATLGHDSESNPWPNNDNNTRARRQQKLGIVKVKQEERTLKCSECEVSVARRRKEKNLRFYGKLFLH